MVREQYLCWREQLAPALAEHGICFLDPKHLSGPDLTWLENFFRAQALPVLDPAGH